MEFCQYNPMPVMVNQAPMKWNGLTRLENDNCYVKRDILDSQGPGNYQLSGYDPACICDPTYAAKMGQELFHEQKQYRNTHCTPNLETSLIHPPLTNMAEINQLYTRPYLGHYMGAGQRSIGNKDIESALIMGVSTTRTRPCNVLAGVTINRYQCLPEFGNPQREQHIVPPPTRVGGWIRGGAPTRDYVRRVDYAQRCANKKNRKIVG